MNWIPRWSRMAMAMAVAASFYNRAQADEFLPYDPFAGGAPVVQPDFFDEFGNPYPSQPVHYNSLLPESLQRTETTRERDAGTGDVINLEGEQPSSITGEGMMIETNEEGATSEGIETKGLNDAAMALQESPEVQSVNIQRRSAVAFDPRIRGYHLGQVYTQGEGINWLPVRPDLDSMLNRFDPRLINRLDVINGPYSSRFGPGFAFLDMDLGDTQRFDCYQANNRLGYIYRTNGQQQYAVDTFWGGNTDYGFLFNYAYRNGIDYRAGNGQKIPSSYLVNNVTGQFGFDLGLGSKIEMRYDFLDQHDTQIPGQFFDLDELETHSFLVSYINEDDSAMWTRMKVDAWHNRTPAHGTVQNDGVFNVQERVETALDNNLGGINTFNGGFNARVQVSGGRWEYMFGDADDALLYVGADVRQQRQLIQESFEIRGSSSFDVNTALPDSEMLNPGAYAELRLPMTGNWTTVIGGRGDYVHAQSFQQATHDDGLYSLFMSNEYLINDCWTGVLKFGHAQRPPTLVERYSRGTFVSVLQSGFSRVVGNDTLGPERLWQIDAGLAVDYGDSRANIVGFHSWINDYITYQGSPVIDPTGAQLLQYVTTDLATLTGFEGRAERDLSSRWRAFIAGHYVHGTDQTLGAPLWGISPVEGQVGLLWHDDSPCDLWGVETTIRAVDRQDRLAVIRSAGAFSDGQFPPITIEQETPGFANVNIRSYWNPRENLRIVAGIENLLDATYLQHVDLRLPSQGGFAPGFAYAPGFTPYMGIDWTY